MDYLPSQSQGVLGLKTMEEAYNQAVPSVRAMVKAQNLDEAANLANQLDQLEGVTNVLWYGDVFNTGEPLSYQDSKAISDYYQDGHFLYTLTIDQNLEQTLIPKIKDIVGPDASLSGSSVTTVYAMVHTEEEIGKIFLVVVGIVFSILIATTSSWFEPVLFIVAIGTAIAINRGTNIFFGEISFVTNAAAMVLQLAVSMDYAIFLLHRFSDYRQEGFPVKESMQKAMEKSFSPILASASTTVFGFAALLAMQYRIGFDLGLVLGKSVVISLVTVMILLPVLAVRFSNWIDKTHHRQLELKVGIVKGVVRRFKVPVLILFVVVSCVGFLAQNQNVFQYGISEIYKDPQLSINQEKLAIDKTFGQVNQLVILMKKGAVDRAVLTRELASLPNVIEVISFSEVAGQSIPEDFVPAEEKKDLISGGFERLLVKINTKTEGETAFKAVDGIEAVVGKYVQKPYYIIGETPNTYDLKNTVTKDNVKVNALAIGAIAIVLVITFKGVGMPLLLLAVIESAIFINLSVAYFTNQPIFYIGYLIIGAVQLGATVDYAILFGSRYYENRIHSNKTKAALDTLSDTALSIITSAGIMAVCGFFLGGMSSNQMIGQLGVLIGRGAMISAVLVMTVLPSAIWIFDKWATYPIRNLIVIPQHGEEKKYEEHVL